MQAGLSCFDSEALNQSSAFLGSRSFDSDEALRQQHTDDNHCPNSNQRQAKGHDPRAGSLCAAVWTLRS